MWTGAQSKAAVTAPIALSEAPAEGNSTNELLGLSTEVNTAIPEMRTDFKNKTSAAMGMSMEEKAGVAVAVIILSLLILVGFISFLVCYKKRINNHTNVPEEGSEAEQHALAEVTHQE